MKKYLEMAKLFIFEELVKVVLRISKNYTLIRLERVEKMGVVDFVFTIRPSTEPIKENEPSLDFFVVRLNKKQNEKTN